MQRVVNPVNPVTHANAKKIEHVNLVIDVIQLSHFASFIMCRP
jgi:hypothetical protein